MNIKGISKIKVASVQRKQKNPDLLLSKIKSVNGGTGAVLGCTLILDRDLKSQI